MKHHPRYCECSADHCGACLLHNDGYKLGREEERAAIVAWLRTRWSGQPLTEAECIERADHLRPDSKDGEGET